MTGVSPLDGYRFDKSTFERAKKVRASEHVGPVSDWYRTYESVQAYRDFWAAKNITPEPFLYGVQDFQPNSYAGSDLTSTLVNAIQDWSPRNQRWQIQAEKRHELVTFLQTWCEENLSGAWQQPDLSLIVLVQEDYVFPPYDGPEEYLPFEDD